MSRRPSLIKASERVEPQYHRSYIKMMPKGVEKTFNQAETISRGAAYWVENSLISQYMICQIDDSDNIACTLGAEQDSFEFKIQDFSEWREVNDHHMDTIFEEQDYNKASDE